MRDKLKIRRPRGSRYIAKWSVVFCLLIALVVGGFVEGSLPFHFLCALVTAVLLSGLQTALAARKLRLAQRVARTVVTKNETFTLDISMENHAFPFFLPFVEARVEDFHALTHPPRRIRSTILPLERVRSSVPVCFPYRGQWSLGLSHVRATDLTGLFRVRIPLPPPLLITVRPRIIPLRSCALATTTAPPMRRRMPWFEEDPFTLNDVRSYQYGDPLKRIHWKLSARKGDLMSKVMDREPAPSALFLLDVTLPDGDIVTKARLSDRIVEVLVSVLHHCLTQNIPVRLIHRANGGLFIDEQNNREDFNRLLNHLSILSFSDAKPLYELNALFNRSDTFGFLIFTVCLTDELAAMAHNRHQMGTVTEVIALSSSMTKPLDTKLPVYRLPEEGDFASILEGGARRVP